MKMNQKPEELNFDQIIPILQSKTYLSRDEEKNLLINGIIGHPHFKQLAPTDNLKQYVFPYISKLVENLKFKFYKRGKVVHHIGEQSKNEMSFILKGQICFFQKIQADNFQSLQKDDNSKSQLSQGKASTDEKQSAITQSEQKAAVNDKNSPTQSGSVQKDIKESQSCGKLNLEKETININKNSQNNNTSDLNQSKATQITINDYTKYFQSANQNQEDVQLLQMDQSNVIRYFIGQFAILQNHSFLEIGDTFGETKKSTTPQIYCNTAVASQDSCIISIPSSQYRQVFGNLFSKLNFLLHTLVTHFPNIKREILLQLTYNAEEQSFPIPLQQIYRESEDCDGIYIVKSGEVHLTKADRKIESPLKQGKIADMSQPLTLPDKIIDYLTKGSIFGFEDLFRFEKRVIKALAINKETVLFFIRQEQLQFPIFQRELKSLGLQRFLSYGIPFEDHANSERKLEIENQKNYSNQSLNSRNSLLSNWTQDNQYYSSQVYDILMPSTSASSSSESFGNTNQRKVRSGGQLMSQQQGSQGVQNLRQSFQNSFLTRSLNRSPVRSSQINEKTIFNPKFYKSLQTSNLGGGFPSKIFMDEAALGGNSGNGSDSKEMNNNSMKNLIAQNPTQIGITTPIDLRSSPDLRIKINQGAQSSEKGRGPTKSNEKIMADGNICVKKVIDSPINNGNFKFDKFPIRRRTSSEKIYNYQATKGLSQAITPVRATLMTIHTDISHGINPELSESLVIKSPNEGDSRQNAKKNNQIIKQIFSEVTPAKLLGDMTLSIEREDHFKDSDFLSKSANEKIKFCSLSPMRNRFDEGYPNQNIIEFQTQKSHFQLNLDNISCQLNNSGYLDDQFQKNSHPNSRSITSLTKSAIYSYNKSLACTSLDGFKSQIFHHSYYSKQQNTNTNTTFE